MKKNKGIGAAHGKVILIGEHAVVYGVPAIALPLTDLKVNVEISSYPDDILIQSTYFSGSLSDVPVSLNNLKTVIEQIIADFSIKDSGMKILVESDLPSERGMGSSAAVATALVKALFDYFEIEINDELLNKYVTISETIAHGNPSGIDALVVKSDDPYEFKKNSYAHKLTLDLAGYLVLADTGQEGQTKEAIQAVAEYKEQNPEKFDQQYNQFIALIQQALQAIEKKDVPLLGVLMDTSQTILSDWGVSNEKLNLLVDTARENGAIGAKLTGGGRGGCMIALVDSLESAKIIAQHLEMAGAAETWLHSLENKEVSHAS